MIGRGSYGRPWLPGAVCQRLASGTTPQEPPLSVKLQTILEHYEDMLIHYGCDAGMRVARKHIGWYSKGLPGSTGFRDDIMRQTDPEQVRTRIRTFFSPLIEETAA